MYSTTLHPVHASTTKVSAGVESASVFRQRTTEKARSEPEIPGGIPGGDVLKSAVPLALRAVAPVSAVFLGALGMSLLAGNPLLSTVLVAVAPMASELVNGLADYIETEDFSNLEAALFKAGNAVLPGAGESGNKRAMVSGIATPMLKLLGSLSAITTPSQDHDHKASEATSERPGKKKRVVMKKTRKPVNSAKKRTKAKGVRKTPQPGRRDLHRGIAPEDWAKDTPKKVKGWFSDYLEHPAKGLLV